jgi:hypothetical protein
MQHRRDERKLGAGSKFNLYTTIISEIAGWLHRHTLSLSAVLEERSFLKDVVSDNFDGNSDGNTTRKGPN